MKIFKKNSLLLESSIYLFLSFIQKGLSFLLIPFYTYFLAPEEFGLVNQVIALHSIFIIVLTFSLNESLAKNIVASETEEESNQIKTSTLAVNVVIVLIGLAILFIFNHVFYDLSIGNVGNIKYYSIVIVITSPIFLIYQKYLRIKRKPMIYAKMMIGNVILQIVFSFIFIYLFDLGSHGYMLSLALPSLIFAVISYSNLFSFNFSLFKLSEAKSSLKYSLKLFPHNIAGWGMNGFTNLALGNLGNVAMVGILNAINIVGVFINVFSKSILDAFQPWIYEKLKSKEENNKQVIASIINILCTIIVLMGVIIISFDKFILENVISPNYHYGIEFAPLLVLNSVLLSLGSMTVYIIYYYDNKVKYVSISTIIGALINIIFGYFLIFKYKLMGAILALVIANFIISIIKVKISSSIIKEPYRLLENYLIIISITLINYYYKDVAWLFNFLASAYLIFKILIFYKKTSRREF